MFIITLFSVLSLSTFLPVFLCDDNFVQKLNKFYKFDHNIYIFTNRLTMSQEGIYDNDVPKTTLRIIGNNINYNYRRIAIPSAKNRILFVFTNATPSTKIFQLNATELNVTMQLSYWNMKIKVGFIVRTDAVNEGSMKFVKDIIDWCWSNLIIDMFVLLRAGTYDQVFTFNPYKSADKIIKVEPKKLWKYFHDKSSNLYGYKLHLSFPVEVDFLMYSFKRNEFTSKDGKLCEYILNGLNATYYVTMNSSQPWNSYVRQVIAREVDFSPRRYSIQYIDVPVSRVFTYPVGTEEYILLVPSAIPYNQFQAFLKHFTNNNSIIKILGPIMLIITILWAFKAFKYRESRLFQSVVDVIGLLFTLDVNGTRNHTDMDVRLFVISLSVGGFFFINTILSLFISLLMQPVMQSEINTFDQFDQTALKIKVPTPEFLPHMLELAALNKRDWKNRIEVAKSNNEMILQINNYDTKYAYYFSSTRTDVLLARQKQLSIRGFYVPGQYLRTALNAYSIGARAPFRDRVDYLIMQAFSAGLYDKWRRDTYPNITRTGYFNQYKIIREEPEQIFAIPVVILYGYLFSIIVFMLECGFFYLKKRRDF